MSEKNGTASLASKPLDSEDAEALARVAGSAYQGTESASPAAEAGQPASAVNSPGALLWAGHVVNLVNQFFVGRFGPEAGLAPGVLEPIRQDIAAAIDAYLPAVEAKPGVFALVALGGHFFACQRAALSAKPSASSAAAGPEKQPSSSSSSESERGS